MAKTVNCTEEVVIVSNGRGDNGKLVALSDGGKLDPSVIPSLAIGSKWFNGSTDPVADIGVSGDYYLNTSMGNVYQKSTNNTWVIIGNIRGLQGEKGNIGELGPQGPKGDKGEKGDIGVMGPQGILGPKGDKGDPGEIGTQGVQGSKGDIGATGPQGIKGDKGDKGDPGVAFDTGHLFAQNGYQILNNGLTLQWGKYGTFSATGQRKTIDFNIAFPTEVLNIQCTAIVPTVGTWVGVPEVISYTKNSFDVVDGDNDNTPWDIFWFAIGH